MPQQWKDDFNRKIIGEGRLWTDHPNESDHPIHPQWRISLNENLLSNIFENPFPSNPPTSTDRLTFNDYYGMRIATFIDVFRSRLESVPSYARIDEEGEGVDTPQDKYSRFTSRRIKRAKSLLRGAKHRAEQNDASTLVMKDLYLDASYADPAKTEAIDDIYEHFWSVQQALRWICMPFLQYSDRENDTPLARPSQQDLNQHLTTGTNDQGQPIFPVGALTYRDFIYLPTGNATERQKYKRTREFAISKGFFDRQNVFERYTAKLASNLAADFGAELPDYYMFGGGGNGYKCYTNSSGQRSCIPSSDPSDYCANGGQTCAT